MFGGYYQKTHGWRLFDIQCWFGKVENGRCRDVSFWLSVELFLVVNICLTDPTYFEKIEPTKPPRADVVIVVNWIEGIRASEYLFLFAICKRVVKGVFESIHCNDSDQAFCLQILRRDGILTDRLGFPILRVSSAS
jgi:hypothetical protein